MLPTPDILEALRELGLTEKEGLLYLELLKLGTQPASVIARTLALPRSTAQFLAETLSTKGFASKTIKNSITYYAPEKPQNLKKVLDIQVDKYLDKVQQQKFQLDRIAPYFHQLAPAGIQKPQFTFYEGIDNVMRSYVAFLEDIPQGSEILSYTLPASEEYQKVRKGVTDFIDLRLKKSILCKNIMPLSDLALRYKAMDDHELRETRICSKGLFESYVGEITIAEHKIFCVARTQSNAFFSTATVHSDISFLHRELFELAWKEAKKEDQEICRKKEIQKKLKQFQLENGFDQSSITPSDSA